MKKLPVDLATLATALPALTNPFLISSLCFTISLIPKPNVPPNKPTPAPIAIPIGPPAEPISAPVKAAPPINVPAAAAPPTAPPIVSAPNACSSSLPPIFLIPLDTNFPVSLPATYPAAPAAISGANPTEVPPRAVVPAEIKPPVIEPLNASLPTPVIDCVEPLPV